MGDMAEGFKQMNKLNKRRKNKNLTNNQQALKKLGGEFFVDMKTQHHYHIIYKEFKINYWPSTNKWMSMKDKKVYSGDFNSMINWVKKHASK